MRVAYLLRIKTMVWLTGFILVCTTSCTAVKQYDKVYLNDEEMLLSERPCTAFETNFQVYREGASGVNGGKSGGGCGCN